MDWNYSVFAKNHGEMLFKVVAQLLGNSSRVWEAAVKRPNMTDAPPPGNCSYWNQNCPGANVAIFILCL
jgi:hypothetical protein